MEGKILEIVANICGLDTQDITPDLDLFEAGFLDSFGVLELLVTLSEEFQVELDVSDITREQVSSVSNIGETISEKKGDI